MQEEIEKLKKEIEEHKYHLQIQFLFEDFLLGINKKIDIDNLGKYITSFIKETFHVKVCSLIIEEERFSTELEENKKHKETERAVLMEVIRKRAIVVINDIKNDTIVFHVKNEEALSLVALPILDEQNFVAVLYIYDEKGSLQKQGLEVLSSFLKKAAPAVANAIKYNVMKKRSMTDYLTETYNRSYFLDRLRYELKRMKKFLSVIMLDIDFFKKYNDTNGYIAGDIVLKEPAQVLKENLRPFDTLGRYGGEEFIIILPEVENKEATEVCERLRSAVEKYGFKYKELQPEKNVTISLGLTTTVTKDIEINEIIHEADKNLYQSKNNGKNRVTNSIILSKDMRTQI